MADKDLTKAYITSTEKISSYELSKELGEINSFKESNKLLIIQSTSEKCIRITIYPLRNEAIIKLILMGSNISDESIERLSNILQNYEIIHTSGLFIKGKELFYECYLNQELKSEKTDNLKLSLDRFKKVFKTIRIEEIV